MQFERICRSMALALALGALASPLAAQTHGEAPAEPTAASPDVARRAAAIARQTMSPFCPGRTLADCPSNYAAEWREDIRRMVARGMTPEQIQAELYARAGGDLSGIPNRRSSYWLPLGIGLSALGVLAFVFTRLRRTRPADPASEVKPGEVVAEPAEGPIDDQRLAAELDAEGEDD